MEEAKVHDLIIKDRNVKNDILSILNINGKVDYIHEDKYINGIIADFTLLRNDNKICAIIECKGSKINVTDYVRGIGQVLQYEYFFEKKISLKHYTYLEEFSSVLLFPSSLLINSNLNISMFKYPKTTKIIELNEKNHVVREITEKELTKFQNSTQKGLVAISQYYFRDNRLIELFLLLKYLGFLSMKGFTNVNRKRCENSFLRKLETINNNNWRNAFITLSSLGLINSNNLPTQQGMQLLSSFEEFAAIFLDSYIKPYVECIFDIFSKNPENLNLKNMEISNLIKKEYKEKDVLFLTESNGRYISSWLNILRDDYGCIKFAKGSSERILVYNPCELNKNALISKIGKNNKIFHKYLIKYKEILSEIGA